jgi:hypothetical protein
MGKKMAGFFGRLWAQAKQELVNWVNNLVGTPEGRKKLIGYAKKLGAGVLAFIVAKYFGLPFFTLFFFVMGGFLISAAAKKYSLPRIVTAILLVVLVLAAGINFALQKNRVTKKSMSEIILIWDVELASRLNTGNAKTKKVLYDYLSKRDHETSRKVNEDLEKDDVDSALVKAREMRALRNKVYSAFDNDLSSKRKPLRNSSAHVSKRLTLVFEKPYTFADAFNEYGQIDTFKFVDDGVNVGDRLEVIAKPIDGGEFSGKEVGIWRGEKFSPPWNMTVNGYYSSTVGSAPAGKIFMISLNSRKDLIVTVRDLILYT